MFLQPTDDQGRELFTRGLIGPVTMLNLLRFREVADYSASPELAPEAPISGEEAYDVYERHTLPFLIAAGGALTARAEGGPVFIGPPGERWDRVLLVTYPSLEAFMAMATNEPYLAGLGHRTAALEDSRLLPITLDT
ncbi:MAG: DUF1330 domain-containing protein [Acidimicrobiia bacterium]|nr:DUF1330 domain-containing protein [Acidimicrobiia bacterium]